jgi:hypothetical protein
MKNPKKNIKFNKKPIEYYKYKDKKYKIYYGNRGGKYFVCNNKKMYIK